MTAAKVYGFEVSCHHAGYQAYYLGAIIRNVLRTHYGMDPLYRLPGLGHLVWSPDNASDGGDNPVDTLRIDLVDKWNPSRAASLAAILVRTNDYSQINIALGSGLHMSPGFNYMDSTRYYTKLIAGSTTVFCLSRVKSEASLLGMAVHQDLQENRLSIKTASGLAKFEVTKVQAPKPLREKPSYFASPVTVEFGYFYTHQLESAEPKLGRVKLSFQTN